MLRCSAQKGKLHAMELTEGYSHFVRDKDLVSNKYNHEILNITI